MWYPTKIQRIKRAKSEQWYVNFPAAVAQEIEFQQAKVVEWLIDDHQRLVLQRSDQSVADLKKNSPRRSKRSIGGHFFRMPILFQAVSELAKSRKAG